jgi:hypothetical protein
MSKYKLRKMDEERRRKAKANALRLSSSILRSLYLLINKPL